MNLRFKLIYKAWRLDGGRNEYYRHAATLARIEEIADEIRAKLNPMYMEIIDTQSMAPGKEDTAMEIKQVERSERFARLISALMDEQAMAYHREPSHVAAQEYNPMGQIPYMVSGASDRIRHMLIVKLGYTPEVADSALISWRGLDNGQYGWIAEFANGTVHYWDEDRQDFIDPKPRVGLTDAQVNEMLVQMNYFGELSEVAANRGDIDTTVFASHYVVSIARMLG